jgi:hypothetical protein
VRLVYDPRRLLGETTARPRVAGVLQIPSLPSKLYYTYIKLVPHVTYKVIFQNVDAFQIWHDRLGHPGVWMMRKIIDNCTYHNLTKFSKTSDFICTACATGNTEPLRFHERIQGGICGPIQPISGSFRYFMVLIDASTRWSQCVYYQHETIPLLKLWRKS